MKIDVKTDFDFMVSCAVRYALGRRTYAVSVVCDYVLRNISLLDKQTLMVMRRDIDEHDARHDLGDECDIRCWVSVYEAIALEMKRRKGRAD